MIKRVEAKLQYYLTRNGSVYKRPTPLSYSIRYATNTYLVVYDR